MLVEVMNAVTLVLALPLLIAALVLQIRGIAQPDKEAANRLLGWSCGLTCTFVVLAGATSLLRWLLDG